MFRIGGVVWGVGKYTTCEFRDPACYEMVNIIRNCPEGNGFIPTRWSGLQLALTPETDHSRVRVRLAKLKSKIHKPLFELFGQPWTCGKAANEKCELLTINQERCSKTSEHTDRVDGKASPKVISDGVHGSLNRGFEERRNLCAMYEKVWVPVRE